MAEVSTIARPYAKAVFEHAVEKGQLDQWSEMLASLSALTAEPQVKSLLDNPAVSDTRKAEVLIDLAGLTETESVRNFIQALSDHKRLNAINAICQAYEALKAQLQQQVDVEVISAFDLSDAQAEALSKALASKLDRQVNLTSKTDQSLIGGVVIRAGDLVIDGSVKGRIEKMAWDVLS